MNGPFGRFIRCFRVRKDSEAIELLVNALAPCEPSGMVLKETPELWEERSSRKFARCRNYMVPILVVDDSREDIALVTRVFCSCKIRNTLLALHSGQQCIDYFERPEARARGALPCLVLLDLAMKPKSGIEVLKHLSASPTADIADSVFVMLSGVSDYSIVREGYQLGAATFLTKPVQPEELMAMFKSIRGLGIQNQSDGIHVVATKRGKGLSRLV